MTPVVRFEGLPGEHAQFDFGECEVHFVSSGQELTGEGQRLKSGRG